MMCKIVKAKEFVSIYYKVNKKSKKKWCSLGFVWIQLILLKTEN